MVTGAIGTPARPASARWRRRCEPYLYILPAFLPLVVFTYWPLARSLELSLFDWNMVSADRRWVGAANYTALLAAADFWLAVWNTGLYIVGLLLLTLVLPLGLGVLLNRVGGRLQPVYKAIFFSPAVVSFAVAAITWLWIFNPINGVLNQALGDLGVTGPAWLNQPGWVIWAITLICAWKLTGYNLVIFSAGLAGIPSEYYEAADMDGASAFQQFRHISWPLLTPTTFFVVVTTVIYAGQYTLVPIQILTQGGPNKASTNVVYLIYQYGFQFFETGRASALATVVFLMFLGVTLLQQRFLERYVHYDR
ncbi:MAG TPA: sugar ABC transporter permease [Methylomirabilota bacterium]|nr:sugar ABC transporter permease [Methylomirabilota bacterium]